MNVVHRTPVWVGVAAALLMPATASAHPQQPVVAIPAGTQPGSWLVLVMLTALGTFAVIVSAATVLRVAMHRRGHPLGPRTQALLTSSMAGCAVIALVAFVATQFLPATG